MTAPIPNGPTTHGYTTMRDATGNTDELARILASMDPQPTGAPSSPANQAPSQIAGGGTASSGNANGATSTGAGGSGSGAGTSPTQNAPSEF